ncbi:DNA-directed RNA polymerase, variant 2 [Bonamia ostreae]|uniref:DNA-directed RNA polymerase n=1 Tax=Bonamia ostreae TaxID=126728 RepID=A0ABV2AEG0_9EUKA
MLINKLSKFRKYPELPKLDIVRTKAIFDRRLLASKCAETLNYLFWEHHETYKSELGIEGRVEEDDFIETTGYGSRFLQRNFWYILRSNPDGKLETTNAAKIKKMMENFIGCLTELKLIKDDKDPDYTNKLIDSESCHNMLSEYVFECFSDGYVPDPEKLKLQWLNENDNLRGYTDMMRERLGGSNQIVYDHSQSDQIDKTIAVWFSELSEEIKNLRSGYKSKKYFTKTEARLLLLSPDEITSVFIASFFRCWTISNYKSDKNEYNITLKVIADNFGRNLNMETNRKYVRKRDLITDLIKEGFSERLIKQKIFIESKLSDEPVKENHLEWKETERKSLGDKIFYLFLKSAYIYNDKGQKIPAVKIEKKTMFKNHHKTFHVILANEVVEYLKNSMEFTYKLQNNPFDDPMIVRPRNWISPSDGGFLTTSRNLLRTKALKKEYKKNIESIPKDELQYLLDSINSLQNCSWAVNKKVLAIVNHYFKHGQSISGLPGTFHEKESPKSIEKSLLDSIHKLDSVNLDSRTLNEKLMQNIKKSKEKNYEHSLSFNNYLGLYATCFLKLQTAKRIRNETFYFPYFLDFRGRCYPHSPYFSHVSDDLNRGIIKFAEKKALNKNGWKWLLIHLCNLYGNNKMSNEDRKKWSLNNMHNIMDSADFPLEFDWWRKGDEPWQILACCFEITEAARTGDVSRYKSNLPVYQDGSCNGLQHYSAMGRDMKSAEFVNLTNGDKPKDAYVKVLEIAIRKVKKDMSSENAEKRKMATILNGKLTRKMIKQTVMTTVYGVTVIGARKQIERQLEKSNLKELELDLYKSSLYLATVVLDSVDEIFTSANKIMEWLRHASKQIAKQGKCVSWLTPLKLPAMQHYGIPFEEIKDSFNYQPNVRSQSLAFPPNFVHSLDSTHMLMTAKKCRLLCRFQIFVLVKLQMYSLQKAV